MTNRTCGTPSTDTTPPRLRIAAGIKRGSGPLRIAALRESIARRVLIRHHASPDVRILQVVLSGGTLIVASDDDRYGIGVDVYRLPPAHDTDPDQDQPVALCDWQSVAELGGAGLDEVDGMMAEALAIAASYVPKAA